MATTVTTQEQALVSSMLERIASDLALICDRTIEVHSITCERKQTKTPASHRVHISFKLELRQGDAAHHGALLLPLPEAIALASYLLMMPEETVKSNRTQSSLDRTLKDAMVEIGNLIGGAADGVLRDVSGGALSVRSHGCQGIRAGQNPSFAYVEGADLLCARAKAQLHTYPAFEMVLQIPPLPYGPA